MKDDDYGKLKRNPPVVVCYKRGCTGICAWTIVKEGWLKEREQYNLLDHVSEFKYRFCKACDATTSQKLERVTGQNKTLDKNGKPNM